MSGASKERRPGGAKSAGLASLDRVFEECQLQPRDWSKLPGRPRRKSTKARRPKFDIVTKTSGLLETERELARQRLNETGEYMYRAKAQQAAAAERTELERRNALALKYARWCERWTRTLPDGEGRWCSYLGQRGYVRTNGDHDHPWVNVVRENAGEMCPVMLGELVLDMGKWRIWKKAVHIPEMVRMVTEAKHEPEVDVEKRR